MKPSNMGHRIVATALLATLAVSAVAPAAFAGNRGHGNGYGHGKHGGYNSVRYKGGPYRRPARPVVVREVHVVEHHHDSNWGPAIAGFIGGVAVGTILSDRGQAQPVYQSGYYYEDPYCHERFSSLDAYSAHTRSRGCDHWPVARVIDRRSGACAQTLCWHDGGWRQMSNDWDGWGDERLQAYNDGCR